MPEVTCSGSGDTCAIDIVTVAATNPMAGGPGRAAIEAGRWLIR